MTDEQKHQIPSYPLRLRHDLKEQLKDVAKQTHRSLNAEISVRLEESLSIETVPEHEHDKTTPELIASHLGAHFEQRLSDIEQKLNLILDHIKAGQ